MAWLLRKTDNPRRGQYVAPGGQESSYTPDALKAKRYPDRKSAERDACENESAVEVTL